MIEWKVRFFRGRFGRRSEAYPKFKTLTRSSDQSEINRKEAAITRAYRVLLKTGRSHYRSVPEESIATESCWILYAKETSSGWILGELMSSKVFNRERSLLKKVFYKWKYYYAPRDLWIIVVSSVFNPYSDKWKMLSTFGTVLLEKWIFQTTTVCSAFFTNNYVNIFLFV